MTTEEIPVQIKKRKVSPPAGDSGPWETPCDVCAERKLKALKSCLTCLTSYCEAHLEPHLRVPSLARHKLSEPVDDLEERTCLKHNRLLELFCREDKVCICLLCAETEHKHHQTVFVEEEWALQKNYIATREAQVKMQIDDRYEKIQEIQRHAQISKEKTEKEIEEAEVVFQTLVGHVVAMQAKLKQSMDLKLRTAQDDDKAMVEKLRGEIRQLQRKRSELEHLSQSEDLLQLLQALDTIPAADSWSRSGLYSDLCVQTVRRALSHLIVKFEMELKTLTTTELTRIRQYKEAVTFDPATAGCRLVVTEQGKRLKYIRDASTSSFQGPERFTISRILGSVGFASGRHYWEVQVGLKIDWDVGVARETVSRQQMTSLTKEDGCFAIGKRGADYSVHSNPSVTLHLSPSPTHVGVYLDYDNGTLSFYDIDRHVHIFSFTGLTFLEKIYPYFYVSTWVKKSKCLVIMS